ncbi:hypothetical protein Tco_0922838 [Tanacetum coccineum]|uniref:Reverse transcriptase domain-containing protein n=1 Tax=Tanacetum coccineum TaxID=301880 RepID=A0ABQ5D092_9ASTR
MSSIGEDENAEEVQIADHLRPMEELLRIPILGIENAIIVPAILADQFDLKPELLDFVTGGNLMTRNTQDALTIIENKARVRTCRNKPQVSSSGGTSTKIDAITVLTKQFEALEYQLMQNQMGQIEEIFQKRQSCVLPSNTNPPAEHKVITSTDGLTLDGSFLSHSNFFEKDQEPETITEVVEIASSKSTPLVPPPETLPLFAPKPKEDPKPNPYQSPIPYPCLLQEENFQALKNPTGQELLNDEIPRDLPPKELKEDEPSTTKSLIKKLLEIDNEIYDSEGDIFFLENLLKDEPSKADKSEIYTLIGLDHFVEIPSGESKVHIEVLSVLWGNRLLDHGRIRIPMWQCFKRDHQELEIWL